MAVFWRIQYAGGEEILGKDEPKRPIRTRGVLFIRVEGKGPQARAHRDYYFWDKLNGDWHGSDNPADVLEKSIDGTIIFKGQTVTDEELASSRTRAQTEPIEGFSNAE